MLISSFEAEQPVVEPVGGRLPMTPSATRLELMQQSRNASRPQTSGGRTSVGGQTPNPYGIYLAQYNSKYKQRMLGEMRARLLASPIADTTNGTFRLGAQRVVPLYESERLVKRMEVDEGGKWQWPSNGQGSPKKMRPSTPNPPTVNVIVDYVGRFDTQPTRRPGSAVGAVTVPISLHGSRSFPNLMAARRPR